MGSIVKFNQRNGLASVLLSFTSHVNSLLCFLLAVADFEWTVKPFSGVSSQKSVPGSDWYQSIDVGTLLLL